eukprot:270150-Pyramimonas_sp.AAC.1
MVSSARHDNPTLGMPGIFPPLSSRGERTGCPRSEQVRHCIYNDSGHIIPALICPLLGRMKYVS